MSVKIAKTNSKYSGRYAKTELNSSKRDGAVLGFHPPFAHFYREIEKV